jgi:hypothetical protein
MLDSTDSTRIIEFYSGRSVDHAGRSLETILSYHDTAIEDTHDFIQWLFPLKVASPANPYAPIVNEEVQAIFQRDADLRHNLLRALWRMLAFYGLRCDIGPDLRPVISRGESFLEHAMGWLRPYNHNHLRLTRIMTCLRLLGLSDYSAALHQCLEDILADYPECVSMETRQFLRNTQT